MTTKQNILWKKIAQSPSRIFIHGVRLLCLKEPQAKGWEADTTSARKTTKMQSASTEKKARKENKTFLSDTGTELSRVNKRVVEIRPQFTQTVLFR